MAVFCSLFGVLISVHTLSAAEGDFQVIRGNRVLPERGVFPEFVIVNQSCRISVLQPQNSHAEIDLQARKLKFELPGYAGTVVLQIATNCPVPVVTENQPQLLDFVQNRFPGATVRPVGAAHVGSDTGWICDVERFTEYKTKLITRLAFVSTPTGVLEASLTSSRYSFSSLVRTFTTFLGCVQIRETRPVPQTIERPREESNSIVDLIR